MGGIAPFLLSQGRGPQRKDDRVILNGIFYVLRTGAPWRDLPDRYGPHTTVYNRYVRWTKRGIWGDILEALSRDYKDALIFVGSSIVKPHRTAAGANERPLYLSYARKWAEDARPTELAKCSSLALLSEQTLR